MRRVDPILRARLDRLVQVFGRKDIGNDPVLFPRRYADPLDQEIVGFVAASLAYGNVLQIRRSVEAALAAAGPSPRRFAERFDPRRDAARFAGFVHRFNRGPDLASLFFLLRQAIRQEGSLGEFFARGWSGQPTVREALDSFVARIEVFDPGPFYGGGWPPLGQGVRFFLPSPRSGSACKRLCMYLRWMVRRDAIDLGLWPQIPRRALVMPVDTHIARIGHRLGLAHLPNATWNVAEELTENLKCYDPEDPVKYDFALSRIGIAERWPRREPRRLAARRLVAYRFERGRP